MDANTLFENHSVEEVRQIERKIRHDIEWKKEEMRDLVGERYRDLISAADTIKQMKVCAENVSTKLSTISSLCQRMKSLKSTSELSVQRNLPTISDQTKMYEVACQIKVLLAVPGRIWKYLDDNEFLSAAKLYLLAKHIQGSLQYDVHSGRQLLSRFPVIAKQWAAISHFKTAIIQGCKDALGNFILPHNVITECLCSIILLEDKSPRQVFQDYLLARMYVGKGVNGVRNHFTTATRLIHNTVFQIVSVFSSYEGMDGRTCEGDLLSKCLKSILEKPLIDQVALGETNVIKRHLPRTVTGFIPSLRSEVCAMTGGYLKSSCDKWIKSCLENVKEYLKDQLTYISTIKSLTTIRQDVYQAFTEDKRMEDWDQACSVVFTNGINIWLDILSPLLALRVKEVIVEQLDSVLSTTENQLVKAKLLLTSSDDSSKDVSQSTLSKEKNMSSFIWCESSNDLPQLDVWVSASQRNFQDGGGLLMKAHGYTPIIQSLCNKLNASLAQLLAEVSTYMSLDLEKESEATSQLLGSQVTISDSTAEIVRDESYKASIQLSALVKQELVDTDWKNASKDQISWVLLLARFCSAVPQLCPDLEKSVTLKSSSAQIESNSTSFLSRSISRSMNRSISIADPLWSQVKDSLTQTTRMCLSIWEDHILNNVEIDLENRMALSDPASLLSSVTRWDEIEIEEAAEDSTPVKSLISVPMQISWSLHDMLYEICREINLVGSHCLSRATQENFVRKSVLVILKVYEKVIRENVVLSQCRSLQYLFDIWYLQALLLWKSSSTNDKATELEKKFLELTEKLQANVDPFDLDVFNPHMQRRIASQRARNLVLLGAVADTERASNISGNPLQSSRSEQHNILPMFGSCLTRFPLLPVVSESVRSSFSGTQTDRQIDTTNTFGNIKPETSGITPLSKNSSEPNFKQSSSFYDRLGSGAMSWFTGGNK